MVLVVFFVVLLVVVVFVDVVVFGQDVVEVDEVLARWRKHPEEVLEVVPAVVPEVAVHPEVDPERASSRRHPERVFVLVVHPLVVPVRASWRRQPEDAVVHPVVPVFVDVVVPLAKLRSLRHLHPEVVEVEVVGVFVVVDDVLARSLKQLLEYVHAEV